MRGRAGVALAGVAALWLHAAPGWAQQPTDPEAGRSEISAGLGWIGSSAIGSRDATLTGAAGDRFRLFSTQSDLGRRFEVHLRLGTQVARATEFEAALAFARPTVTTNISADAENAAATSAAEAVIDASIAAGVRVSPGAWRVGPRVHLFVVGGGGFLRELHEERTLSQTGRIVYAGGGASVPLQTPGVSVRSDHVGIRIDLRAMVRSGGVAFDGQSHVSPVVTGSIFAKF